MKQIDKTFLTRTKGHFQVKYGYEMDDWTAIILYEISEHFSNQSALNQLSINEIEKASSFIKGQVNPVHFSNNTQAFLYGLGKNIWIGVSALVAVLMLFHVVSTNLSYEEKKRAINEIPNYRYYQALMKNGQLETIDGMKCLVFKSKKSKKDFARIGTVYWYNSKTNEIVVPLGRY